MLELQIASIVVFLGSLFVLYRLLVKNYEQNVNLLKDQLEYKHNYKHKLEEIKLFYEEQLRIAETRVLQKETENSSLESDVKTIRDNLDEISHELTKENIEQQKLVEISNRKNAYLENKIRELEKLLPEREDELSAVKDQYAELVQYIKSKHGVDALFEFHYGDNIVEHIKHRRRHNLKMKYDTNT